MTTETITLSPRKTCRACGSRERTQVLDLREQYVSDFVPPGQERNGPRVPIILDRCGACTLVQQRYTAPQDFLYSRHYWYRSGTTATMRAALEDVVKSAIGRVELRKGDVVLDIGSNDGTLLRKYDEWYDSDYLTRVGIEPATNLRHYYDDEDLDGIALIPEFWSYSSYESWWERGRAGAPQLARLTVPHAKVVTACGMFYDLEDPNQFIADVAKVLHPEGVFVAQLMCLKQTLGQRDVGNFCHEHLEFYTLESLERILNRHGLVIFDVEENAVNGGSYRLFIRHTSRSEHRPYQGFRVDTANRVDEFATNLTALTSFSQKIFRNREQVADLIHLAIRVGKTVWVYGASTKGNVLLQWYGLDAAEITGAADKSPEKWGKVTAGTGIPISSEDVFRAANPDYALVLPYAFRDEFIEREKGQEWRRRGGKFIFPLPTLEIV